MSPQSFNDLDYTVTLRTGITITVELKEKRQTYSNWWKQQWEQRYPDTPHAPLFIIDELTVRKLATKGPHAYLLVNDSTGHLDTLFTDFVRVARPLHNNTVKGKLSSSTSTTCPSPNTTSTTPSTESTSSPSPPAGPTSNPGRT